MLHTCALGILLVEGSELLSEEEHGKYTLFLIKILCLTVALSWSVSVDPQQDEEEGQRSLEVGSAVSLMQQPPGRVSILECCRIVLIHLPGALKTVTAGCCHQLLLWVGVPAGVL